MTTMIEKHFPMFWGLVAAVAYWLVPGANEYVPPATIAALLAAVVSVAGIAVGFLATAMSILISIDDRDIVKRIKSIGLYERILVFLKSAILWWFILGATSAAALLLDYKDLQQWDGIYRTGATVWLLASTSAVLSFYRIMKVFYAILKHLD